MDYTGGTAEADHLCVLVHGVRKLSICSYPTNDVMTLFLG